MMTRVSDLKNFKKSNEELEKISKENIISRFSNEATIVQFSDGIKGLSAGSDFTASLILFDNIMQMCQDTQNGPLVFGVPSRSTILFADGSDNKAVDALRSSVQESNNSDDHPISNKLCTWKAGNIELYQ